MKILHETEFV